MAKSPPLPICMLRGHEGGITALYFTNEESSGITVKPSLISTSDVGEIFIWNLKTYRSYHRIKGHNGKLILYVCVYKSSLLSQGRDGLINVWKYVNNQWTVMKTFESLNFGFCAAKLFATENCTYLVAPTGDGSTLTFYDYEKPHVLYDLHYNTTSSIESPRETCMCIKVFLSDSKLYLLLGFDSGYVALWDYESKQEISRQKCHPDVLLCFDYDPKYKRRGISGSIDNVLQVWNIEDGQLNKVHTVTITNPGVNSVKVRDDGKIVITVGQDCAIRVFSWKNLKPLAVLQFHTAHVISLDFYMDIFSKYESVFATGSKDKNICLWSIY